MQARQRGYGIPATKVVWLAALGVLAGCTALPRWQADRQRESSAELESQLDRATAQLEDARQESLSQRQEIARLQERSASQEAVQQILEHRVDNFRRENERLHAELVGSLIETAQSPTGSVLTPVSSARSLGYDLPPAVVSRLESFAERHEGVSFRADEKMCRFPISHLFPAGSDRLDPTGRASLRELANLLRDGPSGELNVMIVGHTTPSATTAPAIAAIHPTDWHLGAHQAIAVEQFLEECGIRPARMGVISYAAHQPLYAEPDPRNARLEIFLLPPDPPEER